ncbi:hypothetical protein YWS52_14890 [Chitiniphilus shinanonensis]
MKTRGYYLPVFQDDSISFDKGRNRWRERLRGAQEVGETKRKSVDTERGERTENTEKTGEIKVADKLSTEVVCGTEKGDTKSVDTERGERTENTEKTGEIKVAGEGDLFAFLCVLCALGGLCVYRSWP